MDGFEVLTPLTDAFMPEHYERAEAGGITGIVTMPWMFYAGPDASLGEKIDGMKRFRKDLGLETDSSEFIRTWQGRLRSTKTPGRSELVSSQSSG